MLLFIMLFYFKLFLLIPLSYMYFIYKIAPSVMISKLESETVNV